MAGKMFIPLENNPETMTELAHNLGLSKALSFHDVYSLTAPDLLALIPRPCLALVVIIPLTPSWEAARVVEDASIPEYSGSGPEEPVLWFKQTIGHACGLIALLHSVLNGKAAKFIQPNSILSKIREEAIPLTRADRAQLLYDSADLEREHLAVAVKGDTIAPDAQTFKNGLHFVSFVRGDDGHLWELEGGRKGPLDRGLLSKGEDVLSPEALEKGLGQLVRTEREGGGDLRFSCIALARADE